VCALRAHKNSSPHTILQAKVHNLYVEYTLNPFSALQQKIQSSRFDEGIREIVKMYQENKGISYA
jgi:hypothetical protein